MASILRQWSLSFSRKLAIGLGDAGCEVSGKIGIVLPLSFSRKLAIGLGDAGCEVSGKIGIDLVGAIVPESDQTNKVF